MDDHLSTYQNAMGGYVRLANDHAASLKNVKTYGFDVSTMTVLVVTQSPTQDKIDLDKFVSFFDDQAIASMIEVFGRPLHVKPIVPRTTKTGKVKQTFYNQVSVWFSDETSKKNVKIFRNGNLHITGEKSLAKNVEIAEEVCSVLGILFGCERYVCDFDVQMINTNFRLSVGLVLATLREALAKVPSVMKASYDPETYPGLNCKYKTSSGRDASLLIFNSGNVIITGIKDFKEFYEAYVMITGFVDDHVNAVKRQSFVPPDASKTKVAMDARDFSVL
jgi:TATA-box binding protein (TBP) (component of TFIID and TFIIIB)